MKNYILCSMAGLLAVSGAQAADLPVKAKAIQYVRICSAYGAGFWYVPGTDTCIKLGGYLRVDADYNAGVFDNPYWNDDGGQHNRYANEISARSRFDFTVDTRTATEYGVVRTFAQADFQFTTLASSQNPNSTSTNLGNNEQLLDTAGGGYVAVALVFIQFAGFTFGKSESAYATPWQGVPGNNTSYLLGGHDTINGVNNIQYTAEFGNGVSGSIGLDEGVVFNRTALYNLSTGLKADGTSGDAYGGRVGPTMVGRIRVDQAWGLFQLSAAAHEVIGSYNTLAGSAAAPTFASELSGHPESKWGGSVMAGLNIKDIPTGAGDDIKVDATWAKGDTKNVISTTSKSPSFAMFGGTSNPAAYQSIGFGATTDGVWLPVANGGDGRIHLTEAFGMRGAFNHNWDPYWSTSIFGSYSALRYDAAAKASYCSVYTGTRAVSADYSCNPDFNVSQLGVITRWTPVRNLTFSVETMWIHLDQNFTGTAMLDASAPKPSATYQFRDQNTFTLNIRAQRNF
jgi:hypothetical protein